MKTNLRLLQLIQRKCDLTQFYDIDLSCSGLCLQGHFKSDICNVLKKLKFKYEVTLNGNLEWRRNKIRVVLTQCTEIHKH